MNSTNTPYIIMMNGYTACLKSTTAAYIADRMQLPIIQSFRLGQVVAPDAEVVNNDLRKRRYQIMMDIADTYVSHGLPVVLDASFNFRSWRDMLYALAQKYGVTDIVTVSCTCTDTDLILRRLAHRQTDLVAPDQEIMSIKNYEKSAAENEPVEDDRDLPQGLTQSVIHFDTGAYTLTTDVAESSIAAQVRAYLQEGIDTNFFRTDI